MVKVACEKDYLKYFLLTNCCAAIKLLLCHSLVRSELYSAKT